MPYPDERASRLGHVPTVNNQAVQDALARWRVTQAKPDDEGSVTSLCVPIDSLVSPVSAGDVKFAITVDGSDHEVEATREHPTVKVGYLRVAGSFLDLDRLSQAGTGAFVNPRELRAAHNESAFDAALPGSRLVRPGLSGIDTWRREVDDFLASTRFDQDSPRTLADALFTMHGTPGSPATDIPVRACPSCRGTFQRGHEPRVTAGGGTCPACTAPLFLADVLRTHSEYVPDGSNLTAISRVMLVSERLMTLSYLVRRVIS